MTPRRAPSVSKAPILREMPLGAPCRQLGDVEQDAPVDGQPHPRKSALCGWVALHQKPGEDHPMLRL
jgi:hypothetical protein